MSFYVLLTDPGKIPQRDPSPRPDHTAAHQVRKVHCSILSLEASDDNIHVFGCCNCVPYRNIRYMKNGNRRQYSCGMARIAVAEWTKHRTVFALAS